jgi:hypothetical protein
MCKFFYICNRHYPAFLQSLPYSSVTYASVGYPRVTSRRPARRRRKQRKCLFAPRCAQRHRRSGAAVMSRYRLLSKPLDDNVVDGNAGAHRDQTARHLIDRRHHAGQRPSRPIRHDHQACRSLRSTSAVRRVRSLCPGLARVAAVRDGLWWTVRLVAEGGHRCLDGARGG